MQVRSSIGLRLGEQAGEQELATATCHGERRRAETGRRMASKGPADKWSAMGLTRPAAVPAPSLAGTPQARDSSRCERAASA